MRGSSATIGMALQPRRHRSHKNAPRLVNITPGWMRDDAQQAAARMTLYTLLAIITTTHACLDAPQRPRRHHHALVTRRWVARRFPRHDPSRYFSIIKAPVGTDYWLLAKNGSYPNAALKSTLNVFKGCDAKLRGCAPPHVAARGASDVHNYAVLADDQKVWGVTGLTSQKRSTTMGLSSDQSDWLVNHVPGLSSDHPGCVERRPNRPVCEYDGRFSLAKLGNSTLLYARGNTNRVSGGRAVTVASLVKNEWGPLRPITFMTSAKPFDVLHDPNRARDEADVYFGAVNENPSVPGTLLGLFPTALKTAASILMAVSCDGSHFSAPIRLFESSHVGGEIVDHAVDGVTISGDDVLMYVHAGVPGVFEKTCAFKALHPKPGVKKHNVTENWREPRSELVGLAIHREKLATWTRKQTRGLAGCPDTSRRRRRNE